MVVIPTSSEMSKLHVQFLFPQLTLQAEAVKLVKSSLLQITMGTDSLTWH